MNNEAPKNNIIRTTLPGSINGYFDLKNIDKLRESFDEILNKNYQVDKSTLEAEELKTVKDITDSKNLAEDFDFHEISEEDEFINDEISEFYEVNEETIFIENKNLITKKDIVLAGLKIVNSKKLSELEIKEYGSDFLKINNFLIQIVITTPTANDVLIPVNHWIKNNKFPQIILCAQVNDESESVYFPGVLTAEEIYKDFEIFNNLDGKEFFISINKFKGGINRLFSILSILKPKKNLKLHWKFPKIELLNSQRKQLVSSLDFLVFLLKTGIPLGDSYELLLENQKDQVIRSIFKHVLKCHKLGINLGTSLSRFPIIFDEISIKLINFGLETGELVESISSISKRIKKKIYIDSEMDKIVDWQIPLTAYFLLIINAVLFEEIEWAYQYWDISVPFPQKLISYLYAGNNLYFWGIPFLVLIAFLLIKFPTITFVDLFRRLIPKKINAKLDNFILKVPILKEIKIKYSTLSFLRNLYYLLIAGVPIVDSLNIAKKYEKTFYFKKLIDQITNKLINGQSFYESIKSVRIFPNILVTFFKIGEEIGQLSEIIGALSSFYESELYSTLNIWKNSIKKYINFSLITISLFLIMQLFATYTTWILFEAWSN